MTEPKPRHPLKMIYIDPHCEDCLKYQEPGDQDYQFMTWSTEPDQDDCPECGRKPLVYLIDRRQLRKDER